MHWCRGELPCRGTNEEKLKVPVTFLSLSACVFAWFTACQVCASLLIRAPILPAFGCACFLFSPERPSLKHQRSALLWAVIKGKQRSVRFLLESGSDADHKDFTGKNAYDWAKQQNHAETVAVLLQFKQGNMGLTVARRGAAISKVSLGV